jgi:DNA-binding NarL/FixJ family response regulator
MRVSVDSGTVAPNNLEVAVERLWEGLDLEPLGAEGRAGRRPFQVSGYAAHRSSPPTGSDHEQITQLPSDRVAELEARLRRIAAEFKAAGVMDDIDTLPAATDYPQLDELSSRQREIVIRLLNAQRVSVIAAELYLSPSTVRNHLVTIFTKFGVHSQVELLAVLRRHQR